MVADALSPCVAMPSATMASYRIWCRFDHSALTNEIRCVLDNLGLFHVGMVDAVDQIRAEVLMEEVPTTNWNVNDIIKSLATKDNKLNL